MESFKFGFLILFVSLSQTFGLEVIQEKRTNPYLLPNHLVPEFYNVKLIPFLVPKNFTIRGRVEITMECLQQSKNITLHSAETSIHGARVECLETGKRLNIFGYRHNADKEFLIFDLMAELKKGHRYNLTIEFTAQLNDKLHGFYRNQYHDKDGNVKYMAATQFEPTYARKAFPCFDEPARKARFEVSLGRTKDLTSISNMPIKPGQEGVPMKGTDEYVWDHYEVSVPMSTYLVAFVVSDFGYETSEVLENNVEFRIWARRDAMDQVQYAKEIGPKLLKYFEDFFQIPYPLPKMDMIAIPDFAAGAMENWGLVTYRETALLYKPGVSSRGDKESVAGVISHELAHQWFGNLVSPSWWTYLWLNEGFASYVEHLGLDGAAPELNIRNRNEINELHRAMSLDVLQTSHPVSVTVHNPDEISEIFDAISYLKGASIIRMMHHFLGTDTFKNGLTRYLNALQYEAANQDDLWHHLSVQATLDKTLPDNLSVKMVMDTWTLQTGFPVVTVARDYDSRTATLYQERFQLSNKLIDRNSKWWIPITHCQPGLDQCQDTSQPLWMNPDIKTTYIGGMPDGDTPVIVNVQETGFYRVNYDPRNWDLLKNQLLQNHLEVHVLNRAQIMDDLFSFARSGLLKYPLVLEFTRYLSQEHNYMAWRPANGGLNFISKMFKRTPAYGDFRRFMRSVVRPLYKSLDHEEVIKSNEVDVSDHDLFKRNVVSWACALSMEECCKKVETKFREWMISEDPESNEANPIDVNMRQTAYCTVVRDGGEKEWNFVWNVYLKSNVGAEKRRLLRALACTRQIWLLNKFLHLAVTPNSGIKKQDVRSVFSLVASNVYGRDLAFDFIRDKWIQIKDYLGPKAIGKLVKGSVLSGRNTRLELKELKQFYRQYKDYLGSGLRAVKQAIERTERNVEWMEKNYQEIWDWLKMQNEKNLEAEF